MRSYLIGNTLIWTNDKSYEKRKDAIPMWKSKKALFEEVKKWKKVLNK